MRASGRREAVLGAAVGVALAFGLHGGAAAAQAPPAVPPRVPLALRGVTVIDVATGQRIAEQTVVIVGSRIERLGAVREVRVPRSTRVVDARGKYLIPGLWDMHAHLWYLGRYLPEFQYPSYIVNGVTGIRSLNAACLDEALHRRRAIATGEEVGPRQFVSGPALDDNDSKVRETCGSPFHLGVPTPERARHVVDSLHAAGADLLKVYGPTREVYFAIAAEARRVGIPFGGHLPIGSLLEGSDSGQRIVDHAMGAGRCLDLTTAAPLDDSAVVVQCARMAAHLRRNGTWLELEGAWPQDLTDRMQRARVRYWPDSVYRSKDIPCQIEMSAEAAMKPATEAFRAARPLALAERVDLPLVLGTDALPGQNSLLPVSTPGFSVLDAILSWVDWGLTPRRALQAATLDPARALGATDSLGTVAPGKLADLVLLDGDPLGDIYNLRKIRAVLADGRYYDRAALDALLADLERRAGPRRSGCAVGGEPAD